MATVSLLQRRSNIGFKTGAHSDAPTGLREYFGYLAKRYKIFVPFSKKECSNRQTNSATKNACSRQAFFIISCRVVTSEQLWSLAAIIILFLKKSF